MSKSGIKNRKMRYSAVLFLFIAGVVLAAVVTVVCLMWQNGLFLPRWAEWESDQTFSDPAGEYEITLRCRKITVSHREDIIWTSPDGVKVQGALSCDIDNDRQAELILLCWKRGRYGIHKPFWVEKDESGWSQHIFVYKLLPEAVQPQWMSSYIGQNVAKMRAGKNDFGINLLQLTDPDGHISDWRWDSWGFSRMQ